MCARDSQTRTTDRTSKSSEDRNETARLGKSNKKRSEGVHDDDTRYTKYEKQGLK